MGRFALKACLVLSSSLLLAYLLRDWALRSPYCQIKEITVKGNRLLEREKVLQIVKVAQGRNIFGSKASLIEDRLEANPIVERAQIVKRPPQKIEVRLKEKEPLFLVNRGGKLLVAGDGFILTPPSPVDLPILSGEDDLGKRYAEELLFWMKMEDPTLLDMVSEIGWKRGRELNLWLQDGCRVEVGEGNLQVKISRLRRLLALLKDEGEDPGLIDLRFKGQAVVSKGREL